MTISSSLIISILIFKLYTANNPVYAKQNYKAWDVTPSSSTTVYSRLLVGALYRPRSRPRTFKGFGLAWTLVNR